MNNTTNQLSTKELLEIFPEAKEIIKQKLKEYSKLREDKVEAIKAYRLKIHEIAQREGKEDFFIWFWEDAVVRHFMAPYVADLDKHISRLEYQSSFFKKDNRNQFEWEDRKRRAKNTPISDLHGFEKPRILGSRIQALCPFHNEKSPSFVIYTNQNTFHCYGCQANGDSISFVMLKEKISFQDAVRRMA